MTPRVSMLAAIDNFGEVYLSLTQANTSANVWLLFYTKLVEKLQRENPDFRRNTLIVVDGCSAHVAKAVKEQLLLIGVPLAVTAGYSYQSSPIEYFFSQFKRTDLNLERKPMGKKVSHSSLFNIDSPFRT